MVSSLRGWNDQAASGATVLAVSSDVAALMGFVDTVALLHEGRIRYAGPAAGVFDAPDPSTTAEVLLRLTDQQGDPMVLLAVRGTAE